MRKNTIIREKQQILKKKILGGGLIGGRGKNRILKKIFGRPKWGPCLIKYAK